MATILAMQNKLICLTIVAILVGIFSAPSVTPGSHTGSLAFAGPSSYSSLQEAVITGIRHWSNSAYTRVVIDVDQLVTFDQNILKADPRLEKSPRLYLDIKLARLSDALVQPIAVSNGMLRSIRAGQYTQAVVRVVLDLESLCDYKVFTLDDPFRIVVDILGTGGHDVEPVPRGVPAKALPKSFTLVLDPGHGGTDPGAIGRTGLKEKDVVLKIALKLREKVRKQLGWKVIMTRHDDSYVSLEERTAMANTNGGDLFVSIHANASRKRQVHGVETYFLNSTTDRDALKLAARESGVSAEKISDLQLILYDLMLNNKVDESSELAHWVQRSMIGNLKSKYKKVSDLGVKQAPFVVLVGAKMPSILVEVSFISNRMEERRLRNDRYLDCLATAILKGLKSYIEKTQMVRRYPPEGMSTAWSSN
jgi:N-acetylmuramoyl-L-alanine amidase